MKNLDKWRKRENKYLALSSLILLIPVIVLLLSYLFLPDLFGTAWPTVVTVTIMICWLAAFIVMSKIFRKIVIIRAMAENGIRLKTDRLFYPSMRKDDSIDAIKQSFLDDGFDLCDIDNGFCAFKKSGTELKIFVVDGAENAQKLLQEKEVMYRRAQSRRQKRAFAFCFLTDFVSNELQELARDVIPIEGGCIMPVFYSRADKCAYYMGGFTGKNSVESYIQKALKKDLLCYEGAFPEKTVADVTDEEKEFDALDLDEIFEQMKSVSSKDKDVIVHMENGQVKLDGDNQNGVIYYKVDNIGLAQMYSVDPDNAQMIYIDNLENLYICSPKVKKADLDMTLTFKKAIETYLDAEGYSYSYH